MSMSRFPFSILLFFLLQSITVEILAQQKLIYILNRGGNNIFSAPLDSSVNILTEQFNQGLLSSYDLISDISSSKLFWTNGITHQILFGNDGGSGIVNIVDADVSIPVDLDIDTYNNKIYWADNLRKKMYRANLDGSEQEAVITDTFANLSSIVVYPGDGLLFFADVDSGKIWSCSLDGNNRKIIVNDSFGYPVRLVIDTIQEKLYWSDDGRNRIERVNLNGTDRETFYQGDEKELPFGLYIDQEAGHLYWTDYGKNQVMRANLDGFDVVPVVTAGLDDPVAIIIATVNTYDRGNASKGLNTNVEKASVTVYPNPASNLLVFSSMKNTQIIKKVRIYDKTGKQVYTASYAQHSLQVDIGPLSEGDYSYCVTIEGQLLTGHFSIIR